MFNKSRQSPLLLRLYNIALIVGIVYSLKVSADLVRRNSPYFQSTSQHKFITSEFWPLSILSQQQLLKELNLERSNPWECKVIVENAGTCLLYAPSGL